MRRVEMEGVQLAGAMGVGVDIRRSHLPPMEVVVVEPDLPSEVEVGLVEAAASVVGAMELVEDVVMVEAVATSLEVNLLTKTTQAAIQVIRTSRIVERAAVAVSSQANIHRTECLKHLMVLKKKLPLPMILVLRNEFR